MMRGTAGLFVILMVVSAGCGDDSGSGGAGGSAGLGGSGGSAGRPDAAVDAPAIDAPAIDATTDAAPIPDAGCVAANCTSPPANVCASASSLTTYPNPGACDSNGNCVYSPTTTACGNGCFNGACNTSAPSFPADATATSTGTVTLDKEANLNPSTGVAPANAAVNVRIGVTPNNGLQSLTMFFTTNDFGSTTGVAMSVSSQSGGIDTFTGVIPGQPAATTVRFYFQGTKWDGVTNIFNPGNNVNYTYVTQ
jgi:hypothetical protein